MITSVLTEAQFDNYLYSIIPALVFCEPTCDFNELL